jgi:hypothetical protein
MPKSENFWLNIILIERIIGDLALAIIEKNWGAYQH